MPALKRKRLGAFRCSTPKDQRIGHHLRGYRSLAARAFLASASLLSFTAFQWAGEQFRPPFQPKSDATGNRTGDLSRTRPGVAETERWTGQRAGDRKIVDLDDIEILLRWCPPGTFTMGSPKNEEKRDRDEDQAQVTLTRGFWMTETEVTQRIYHAVTGSNPSRFKDSQDRPAESLT